MFNLFKKKNFEEISLNCPRCGVGMKKIKKNDVVIDVCRKCGGLWLDNGEIDKLLAWSKNVKNEK